MEIGRVIFGIPWAGVVLSTAAFCALCYWMLRAWTTPVWSLAGGLLAVIEVGPLNSWMNGYCGWTGIRGGGGMSGVWIAAAIAQRRELAG